MQIKFFSKDGGKKDGGDYDYSTFAFVLTEVELDRLLKTRERNKNSGIVLFTDEVNKVVYSIYVE